MDDLIKEFVVETYENLDMLDRAMVELEKDPQHKLSLDNIFRTIHTLKGTCGFVNCSRLEKLAHVGENLLGRIREGSLMLNAERASALLSMVDAVRHAISILEQTGSEPEVTYEDHIQKLIGLTESDALETVPAEPAIAAAVPEPKSVAEAPLPAESEASASPVSEPEPKTGTAANLPPGAPAPTNAVDQSLAKHSSLSESTIRVDVSILDKLMNLVGELVLARNQIGQFSEDFPEKAFHSACQRLNLITSEVQETFMKTRMQPIENVFGKFPRIVRDLCNDLGKQVRIEMSGNQTELDRTIIEAIKDPLTHIVRNSVDHGIESVERRQASGKNAEGVLSLRAYHEGGQVNIEIRDDGAGINVGRVKQKAVEKGLIAAEQAARMSDREAFNLIFLPGFSTVEKVTNLSGRGVGMDVVRTNIAKIGGSVDVHSVVGAGTTLKIKIPLTLAIIPALIVTAAGDRFAIPQISLIELLRLDGEKAKRGIETLHGVPVYRLRGKLLPLAYLSRELKIEPTTANAADANAADADAVNIVVLQADGRQFGLVVDRINDTEEIVVKPLGKHLKGIECFAGATIMGDGDVALILDVLGLAQRAKVVAEVHARPIFDGSRSVTAGEEKQRLLLFEVGDRARMAIPLSLVARLEQLPVSVVEKSLNRSVVQYRGQIMPLIQVADYLQCGRDADSTAADAMHVVVHSENGRSVGLVVGRITDVVDERLTVTSDNCPAGILGSTVIQKRVTDLPDLRHIIQPAEPQFFESQPNPDPALCPI